MAAQETQLKDLITWEARPDLTFARLSAGARTILGFSPTNWMQLVHPEDQERVRREHLEEVGQGNRHECEFRAMTSTGKTLWIRDTAYPSPNGPVGFMIDISMEMERRDRRGELLQMLAHDLKNPIANILMSVLVAPKLKDNDKLALLWKNVGESAKQIRSTLDSVIQLFENSPERISLLLASANLADILAMELQRPRPLLRDKRIHLERSVEFGDLPFECDPALLSQAFSRTLDHAIRAAASDSKVEVRAFRADGETRFSVTYRPELAKPLERLFVWRSANTDLVIARNIAMAHGGSAEAENLTEGRTVLLLRLPLPTSDSSHLLRVA